ncbi:MAG: FtsX-like permease family protein [Candidatus Aminicenantes bacterium]|nr:FtsX-like permease family protein [Candidatus Aminicenantes bacterium]NIM82090.1 FtsX-like permease family protein [Candidatus Aminicenantes bacterium]NIN21484.1 FtsX-like permease family protein [Candidatus Aminicenantes bacterium]NIN45296.1 FtsX-like permease family protein [Candidatus Aminicenantes bacterium]NIN88113.1 FtsX-like permease family protein [Candidatus Aminicenantes bacterium]
MFKNYFKIAFRNIKNYKGYSFINILGLAVGMACCMLLLLWVQDEMSFDKFHEKAENIYRVELDLPRSNGTSHTRLTSYPLGGAIQENIPEVKYAARLANIRGLMIRYGDKTFIEDEIRAVDPSFLQIFTFPLISGNPKTALNQTYSILITEELAVKYFGTDDPLGKIMTVNNNYDFTVTGVMKNVPENSTITFNILVPLEFLKDLGEYYDFWRSLNCHTWVELYPNSQTAPVNKKIAALLERNSPSTASPWVFSLMPITDINLYGFANAFTQVRGNIQSVYIFSGLACLVLIIACINFMNLSTARSSKRALEVGLKKVVGARRSQIIAQFFGESILTTLIAFLFSLILFWIILPIFNDLSAKDFTFHSILNLNFIMSFLGITLITGFLSGSYPALYLSSFQPVKVLAGRSRSGTENERFRKFLVVIQFCLSIIAIVGTMVVYQQLEYMRNKNLGYDKEQLIYLPLRGDTRHSYSVFKDQLLRDSRIIGITGARQRPTAFGSKIGGVDWEGKDPDSQVSLGYTSVDFDFVETMKIDLKEGRAFLKSRATDTSNAFLVNEEVANLMGGNSVIGKRLSALGIDGRIIGVMKNFHYQSVKNPIEPFILLVRPEQVEYAIVRLQKGDLPSSLNVVKSTWLNLFPAYPFEYSFIDDDFAKVFQADQRMGAILKYATIITIFIACLGLFGLAAFIVEKRTKEIGIRKTLGATVSGITIMLTKEFVKWVMMANMIALPIAYVLMNQWLQDYAYPITMDWWIFFLAFFISIIIAILTVSYQSVRVALTNPVNSLKYE